jgi:hypothetical protein
VGGIKLVAALILMGTIASIVFVVMLSQGQFDMTTLLLAASLLGLSILLRRRERPHQIQPSSRGRLLRRLLGREHEEQDL